MTDDSKPPEGPATTGEGGKTLEELVRDAQRLGIQVGRPEHLKRRLVRDDSLPRATSQDSARFHQLLVELAQRAHREGVDVAVWLGVALRQVAAELPGGAEALVEQRPGSWESVEVYQLAQASGEDHATLEDLDEATSALLPPLVQLVKQAHAAHVEIAGWLAAALGVVASALPRKADELLGPGSSFDDFEHTLRLVCGTIGWPEG